MVVPGRPMDAASSAGVFGLRGAFAFGSACAVEDAGAGVVAGGGLDWGKEGGGLDCGRLGGGSDVGGIIGGLDTGKFVGGRPVPGTSGTRGGINGATTGVTTGGLADAGGVSPPAGTSLWFGLTLPGCTCWNGSGVFLFTTSTSVSIVPFGFMVIP